jgi:hypothetical protein
MTILRVRLLGGTGANNQVVQHRFFYANSDGADASQEDLDELAVEFETQVLDTLVIIMAAEIIYTALEVYADAIGIINFTSFSPPKQGSMGGSGEPPFYVMRYTLDRSSLGARSGRKSFSGVVADNFSADGAIASPGQLVASNLVELALALPLTLPNTTVMVPVLAKNYNPVTGLAESASIIKTTRFTGLSTQGSRKLKTFLS